MYFWFSSVLFCDSFFDSLYWSLRSKSQDGKIDMFRWKFASFFKNPGVSFSAAIDSHGALTHWVAWLSRKCAMLRPPCRPTRRRCSCCVALLASQCSEREKFLQLHLDEVVSIRKHINMYLVSSMWPWNPVEEAPWREEMIPTTSRAWARKMCNANDATATNESPDISLCTQQGTCSTHGWGSAQRSSNWAVLLLKKQT